MIQTSGPRTGLVGAALFYGLLWGLGEVTLGHLLHLARVPGLPGMVMASFAVAVMGRVAATARRRPAAAVILAGTVAASFKLLDLFIPGTDIVAVINPAQAILLEALAGAFWVRLKEGAFSPRGTVPVRGQSPQSLSDRT